MARRLYAAGPRRPPDVPLTSGAISRRGILPHDLVHDRAARAVRPRRRPRLRSAASRRLGGSVRRRDERDPRWRSRSMAGRRRRASSSAPGRDDGPRRGHGRRRRGSRRRSRAQVARSLSLDHDGSGWAEVGRRDPVDRPAPGASSVTSGRSASTRRTRRRVQAVIGQRISMRMAARIKARPGRAPRRRGRRCGGQRPATRSRVPQRLLDLDGAPGLPRRRSCGCTASPGRRSTGGSTPKRLRRMPIEERWRRSGPSVASASGRRSTSCSGARAWPMRFPSRIRDARRYAPLYDLPAEPDGRRADRHRRAVAAVPDVGLRARPALARANSAAAAYRQG